MIISPLYLKKIDPIIVLKPLHEFVDLWVCAVEKAMLNGPAVNFPTFLRLCFITAVLRLHNALQGWTLVQEGCVFADQMAH